MRINKCCFVVCLGLWVASQFVAADEAMEKEGLANLLATSVTTDSAYKQVINFMAVTAEASACEEVTDPACVASKSDPEKFHEAVVAGIAKAISKDRVILGYANLYNTYFTKDEIADVLSFVRTPAGKHFVESFSDAKMQRAFDESALSGTGLHSDSSLQQELERRFPDLDWTNKPGK